MASCLLTIIIPFLNEGSEVKNTLESIRNFSDNNVNILLINDFSDDKYNYKALALEYNAQYVENKCRLGVAASRDLGVDLCGTPYFLLLDGHMRFYDMNWVHRIVEELAEDERQLLCCQTKVLRSQNGNVVDKEWSLAYGAYVDFKSKNILNACWKAKEGEPGKTTEYIPCVLGAAYACSKNYWKYLHGLEGLRYYGCDEQYISLKVWLEGGKCKLLKDVVVGHLYRNEPPYNVVRADVIYNRLLISELLFPYELRRKLFISLKTYFNYCFGDVFSLIQANREFIQKNRQYYQEIFTRDIDYILQLNELPMEYTGIQEKENRILIEHVIRSFLLYQPQIENLGIVHGKMSGVLLLVHYSRYASISFFDDLAGDLMDVIYKECGNNTPTDFENGLCGIGWGIEYLIQNNFMKRGAENILEEIDNKIMERDPERITDWSLRSGLLGILYYVVARLKSIDGESEQSVFDPKYLAGLKFAVIKMLEDKNTKEGLKVAYDFINYMETGEADKFSLNIRELFPLPDFKEVQEVFSFDLVTGSVGKALNRMIKE